MRFQRGIWVAALVGAAGVWVAADQGAAAGWVFRTARAADWLRQEDEMLRGQVTELLRNPQDDVDGFRLADGTVVRFPPHVGVKVAELIGPGDEVEVRGRDETRPDGAEVFEASRIDSGDRTIAVRAPHGPKGDPKHGSKGDPKHGPKPGPKPGPPMAAAGRVASFAENRHGDVDGLTLDDGTVVKVPPHRGADLQDAVAVGDDVRIEGRRHETPKGDVHLHADRVTAGGRTWLRDDSDDRPAPHDGPAPHDRPVPPRAEAPDNGVSNADLLRELREIRRVLERR